MNTPTTGGQTKNTRGKWRRPPQPQSAHVAAQTPGPRRGMKTRFCRMQIPAALSDALSRAHTESGTGASKKTFTDTEVKDLIGVDAYCTLKSTLTGHIADNTRMTLARVDDGFFVGLEHGFASVDANADAPEDAFPCEALVSVHTSQVMHRSISELYVPSAVLNVRVHQDCVNDTMQTMTRAELRGNAPAVAASNPFVKPKVAQQQANNSSAAVQIQLLVRKDGDDRQPLVEVPLASTTQDAACKIDIILSPPQTGAAGLKPAKLSSNALATLTNTSSASMLIPDDALQTVASHNESQIIGPKTGVHLKLDGNKVTMICASTRNGQKKFSTFDRDDGCNVTERFTAYISLFPSCIQEHTDSTYIHGARAFLARVVDTACANGALLSQRVTEPPELYPAVASDPALACALIRSLHLRTARPIEDENLAHVFEMLGITAQDATLELPAAWASAGPVSTFALPGPQKMWKGIKNAAIATKTFTDTMRALRPLFNAKKVSITKMLMMIRAAYAAFSIQKSLHQPAFLNNPNPTPEEEEFFQYCMKDFNKRKLSLESVNVRWDKEIIFVYYLSNARGIAFVFESPQNRGVFALGAYIINTKQTPRPPPTPGYYPYVYPPAPPQQPAPWPPAAPQPVYQPPAPNPYQDPPYALLPQETAPPQPQPQQPDRWTNLPPAAYPQYLQPQNQPPFDPQQQTIEPYSDDESNMPAYWWPAHPNYPTYNDPQGFRGKQYGDDDSEGNNYQSYPQVVNRDDMIPQPDDVNTDTVIATTTTTDNTQTQAFKAAVLRTSTDEADRMIQLALGQGDIPALHQPTLRGAAMRLAYIDNLYTNYPAFKPFARTLRSVWLHTEQQGVLKQILAASKPTDTRDQMLDNRRLYYHYMHQFKEMASLPLGCNYWSTVPYYC